MSIFNKVFMQCILVYGSQDLWLVCESEIWQVYTIDVQVSLWADTYNDKTVNSNIHLVKRQNKIQIS